MNLSFQPHPSVPTTPPGCYWACEHPERSYADETCFWPPCYTCMLVAHAVLMQSPEEVVHGLETGEVLSMRTMFERAVADLDYVFPPLPVK